MSKIEWHLEKRKLCDLTPHKDNPRIFTEKGMKDLKNSIDSIGMAQPINITPGGTILSGHARYLTLKNKGEVEVECYVADRELTDEEQKEVLVRLNADDAGSWDFDKLANEWDSSSLIDWGLDVPVLPEQTFDDPKQDEQEQEKRFFKCPCCGQISEMKDFEEVDNNN